MKFWLGLIIFTKLIGFGYSSWATSSSEDCEKLLTPNAAFNDWVKFSEQHPYEFTIQYPPRREFFQENFRQPVGKIQIEKDRPWLLYVHVPFCEKHCYFCNFAVDIRDQGPLYENYVSAVRSELEVVAEQNNINLVQGIDIGGGTPTRLPLKTLELLIAALKPFQGGTAHPFKTSIETTPSIASSSMDKLVLLKSNGVERVSMGIQSFNEEHLALVNRGLHQNKNEQATSNIRAAGFKRFNVDMIFGLPEQTEDVWKQDLKRVVELQPDSITTYDCLYRGKGRALTKSTSCIPSLEQYGRLYDMAFEFLTTNGYHAHYGGVNFSRFLNETGTSAYFEGRLLDGLPYIGVGNYSSSWVDDLWTFNVKGVNDYIEKATLRHSVIGDSYQLPQEELFAKYILFSLNYGFIDEIRFQKKFGVELHRVFAQELEWATQKGWLKRTGVIWTIPFGNFKNINRLRSLFYSKNASAWVQKLYDSPEPQYQKIQLLIPEKKAP